MNVYTAMHKTPPKQQTRVEAPPNRRTAMATSYDILVVDDEVEIAEFIADILRDEGYTVRILHDGASALLAIFQASPGLVILDIAMPAMMGDELLRYLRRNGFHDLPIIIMTAGVHPHVFLAQGATDVLAKPFDVDVLLDKVAHYLPSPHSEEQ